MHSLSRFIITSYVFLFLLIFFIVHINSTNNSFAQQLDQVIISEQVLAGNKSDYLWPNGSRITVSSLNSSFEMTRRVVAVANEWSRYANIKFVAIATKSADVRIKFLSGGPHNSAVGIRYHKLTPYNLQTMNLGFSKLDDVERFRGIILHEFGHVLGLAHEQFHSGAKIPFDREKVYDHFDCTSQRKLVCWSRKIVDFNILNPQGQSFAKYDPDSIMHYAIPNSWTIGDFQIRQNRKLSFGDKKAIALLYPGAPLVGKTTIHRREFDGDLFGIFNQEITDHPQIKEIQGSLFSGIKFETVNTSDLGGRILGWSEIQRLVSFVKDDGNSKLVLSSSQGEIPLKQGQFTLSTAANIRGMSWDGKILSYVIWNTQLSQSQLIFQTFDGDKKWGGAVARHMLTSGDNVRGWSLSNNIASYVVYDSKNEQTKVYISKYENGRFSKNSRVWTLSGGDNIRGWSFDGRRAVYTIE